MVHLGLDLTAQAGPVQPLLTLQGGHDSLQKVPSQSLVPLYDLQDAVVVTEDLSSFSDTSSSEGASDSSDGSDSEDECDPVELELGAGASDEPSSAPARLSPESEEGSQLSSDTAARSGPDSARLPSFVARPGPSNRVPSTSVPHFRNKGTASASPSYETFASRSASVQLRHTAALNACRSSHGETEAASVEDEEVVIEIEQDADDEAAPEECDQGTERSAASKRLFAALARDQNAGDGDEATSLPARFPGLSSRRGNRSLPSLEQIQSRVSGLGLQGTGTTFANSPAPAKASPAFRTPLPATPHNNRSVSCPTPKSGKWWQFGEVTVTVTPPTPQPQAKSPIVGYVLQNSGRPVHAVKFDRSRDDLELLAPPPFELAPGRQRIMEERAQQAMETMIAMQAAAREHHRSINNGSGQLIGLGWPGSPVIGSPVPPILAHNHDGSASPGHLAPPTMQAQQQVAFAPQVHPLRRQGSQGGAAEQQTAGNRHDRWREVNAIASPTGKYVPPARRRPMVSRGQAVCQRVPSADLSSSSQQPTNAARRPRSSLPHRIPSSAPVMMRPSAVAGRAQKEAGEKKEPEAEPPRSAGSGSGSDSNNRADAGRKMLSRLGERMLQRGRGEKGAAEGSTTVAPVAA